MRKIGPAILIPFLLVVPPIVGWFIGNWLDHKMGTAPYMMLLFLIFGIAAAFLEVYKVIKNLSDI